MSSLYSAVDDFNKAQTKKVREYSGILGLPVSTKTVKVPGRNGYVYVRLRDNDSEIIQAYNDKVSPVFNLPVIIIRQGTGWRVKDRDIERYNDWGSYAPFLPEHHFQHEFNRDTPGGDVVFVYPQQFTPMLVTPISGTSGGPNVLMQLYSFKKADGTWLQAGITGTESLLTYRPTDNQATVAMVFLDRTSGNPGILINSGSYAPSTTTGTHGLLQYLPSLPSSDYEPLAMVRMVSGTESIEWGNIYDIRQFFSTSSTGTGGGGIAEAPIDGLVYGRKNAGWVEVSGTSGGDATLTANRVVVTNASGQQTTDPHFTYDYDNNVLVLGYDSSTIVGLPALGNGTVHLIGSGTSSAFNLYAFGSSVAGFNAFFRARGDVDTQTAILHGDVIGRVARFRGHDGTDWSNTQAEIRSQVRGDWSSSSHGTDIFISTTPSGTTTMEDTLKVNQAGADLLYGKYNISGSPHTHESVQLLFTHGGNAGIPAPAGTTRYLGFADLTSGFQTTQYNLTISEACKVKHLFVTTNSTQPATGSLVFTILKNGVATAIVITIAAGAVAGTFSNTTDIANIAEGDSITLMGVNNAAATSATVIRCSAELNIPTLVT